RRSSFLLLLPPPPLPTPFPYTTLFRSDASRPRRGALCAGRIWLQRPARAAGGRLTSRGRSGESPRPGRRPECPHVAPRAPCRPRSEEHTSELQSLTNLVCRLLLGKKNT